MSQRDISAPSARLSSESFGYSVKPERQKRTNSISVLLQFEDRYTYVKIGSINITHVVTVADDLAVLARRYCAQWRAHWYRDRSQAY